MQKIDSLLLKLVVLRVLSLFWGEGSTESPLGHGVSTQWIAESGALDLFILPGGLPQDVMYQYAKITGGTELPPLFSIGYHQCRWNYKVGSSKKM